MSPLFPAKPFSKERVQKWLDAVAPERGRYTIRSTPSCAGALPLAVTKLHRQP